MAKKETKYICEVCGLKYQKEEVAEQCERKHFKPVSITDVKYDLQDTKNEYPYAINVLLKNGEGKEKTITYSRR